MIEFKSKSIEQYQLLDYTNQVRALTKKLMPDIAGGRCAYCNVKSDFLERHHLSIEKTGTDVVILCISCHEKWHRENGKRPPNDLFKARSKLGALDGAADRVKAAERLLVLKARIERGRAKARDRACREHRQKQRAERAAAKERGEFERVKSGPYGAFTRQVWRPDGKGSIELISSESN